MFQITYMYAIIVCRKELIDMSKEEQILKLIEDNNGVITTKEIAQNDINRVFLTRLVNKGQLERVKKGLYVLSSTWGDEYFNLTYGNNAIFSYETALYFLNLCETVPSTYHITVNRGYNGSLKKCNNVKLHYVKSEIFEIGRMTVKSPQGQNILCYNAERCICDLLKNKNEVDIEIYNKVIKNYFKQPKRNLSVLEEYSKIFNVYEKFENIMEVLM